jgi:HPt (histidine-containing phosphotransfer) domain-containing protein
MADSAIDRAAYDELKETAGAEFVAELVDTFLAEAPGMLAELRDALAAGDKDRFRRAAHSLKSNSNTFGAVALGVMAKQLELGGLEPVQAVGGASLGALAREYERVAQALAELKNA